MLSKTRSLPASHLGMRALLRARQLTEASSYGLDKPLVRHTVRDYSALLGGRSTREQSFARACVDCWSSSCAGSTRAVPAGTAVDTRCACGAESWSGQETAPYRAIAPVIPQRPVSWAAWAVKSAGNAL